LLKKQENKKTKNFRIINQCIECLNLVKITKMARTPTTQIPLGFKAPDFQLPDVVTNEIVNLKQVSESQGLVVMFICNHCPFVIHVMDELIQIANDYLPKEIGFVAISSNDVVNYPDDDPIKMKGLAIEKKFPFPYLYDETQEVAKQYDAACTPDFSVFNSEMKCIYRGQLDGSRPGNDIKCNGEDLRKVLDLMLQKLEINFEQKPSIGCNIKWK
jgi:peroxiredoxin